MKNKLIVIWTNKLDKFMKLKRIYNQFRGYFLEYHIKNKLIKAFVKLLRKKNQK
jgi:hypothetical protein